MMTENLLRLACFNVRNLALPGKNYYHNVPTYTVESYEKKIQWIARQIDQSEAHIIAFQEIFSQQALKEVLSRTRLFQNARHIGFEPDDTRERLTPSVALVTRLPAGEAIVHLTELPSALQVTLPHDTRPLSHFVRPVLCAPILLPNGQWIRVMTVHLKSRKPDFPEQTNPHDPFSFSVASLRSLIRRGTDAAAIRGLLNEWYAEEPLPLVVMGDFNDTLEATPVQMIMGSPQEHIASAHTELYDARALQPQAIIPPAAPLKIDPPIDHILLSEAFTEKTGFSLGRVLKIVEQQDHLFEEQAEASDHCLTMAIIQLSS